MVLYLFAYPDAHADEIATFIYDANGNVYTRQNISVRMKEFQYSRKRGSTEAYQAFSPEVQLKVWRFWNMGPPLGVAGVARMFLMDFDECAFYLTKVNRSYGHAVTSVRVVKPGHYVPGQKLVVLMAIEPGDPNLPPNEYGSVAWPRRWVRVNFTAGTTAEQFADFVDFVLTSIEANPVPSIEQDQPRVCMWDNLSSHLSPIVYQTVYGRNMDNPIGASYRIVRRPPYHPKLGPIEYAFCMLACELRKCARDDWTTQTLFDTIPVIANQIGRNGGFDNTFEKCGYL